MTGIKSLIKQLNIRKVWEDFVNKRGGCGHFFTSTSKKSVIFFHILPSFLLLPQGTIYFTTTVLY